MRRVLALAVVTLAGCGGGGAPEGASVGVELRDFNGSGQFGRANVERVSAESVRVTIELEGAPARAQPAAVVTGGCTSFDPTVEHRLEPVVRGRSQSTVRTPLDELTTGGYGIAVGGTRPEQFVACGDLLP